MRYFWGSAFRKRLDSLDPDGVRALPLHIYIYTHRCSCKWGPIIIPSLVFPLFHSLFSSALHSSCPSLLWKRSLLPSYRKNSVLTKSAFKARTKRLETVSFPKAFFPFWTHTCTDWGALFFSALFFLIYYFIHDLLWQKCLLSACGLFLDRFVLCGYSTWEASLQISYIEQWQWTYSILYIILCFPVFHWISFDLTPFIWPVVVRNCWIGL